MRYAYSLASDQRGRGVILPGSTPHAMLKTDTCVHGHHQMTCARDCDIGNSSFGVLCYFDVGALV